MPATDRNVNQVTSLLAKSSGNDNSDVIVWADPITRRLYVDALISSAIVSGNLTNNNAAPAGTNIGSLVALANASAPSWSEGKQVLLSTDLSGNLRVTGSLSVGGTTDGGTFTAGTSTGTPAMGFYKSTITAVSSGQAGALAMDANRSLFTVIRDAAGNARGTNVDANNNLQIGQGTAANLNATVVGTGTFAVQAALNAETTKVIGTINIAASQTLATVTTVGTVTSVTTVATVTAVTTVSTVTSITNAVTVIGAAASGASKSGNPVQIGGVFNTTQPTVTTGQAVEMQSTARGAQIVATGVDAFSITVGTALPAGTNVIGHVIVDSGTITAVTAITNALPAGTNVLGKVGIDQTTPGTTNAVAATLNAETTKVIGTINIAASQTLATVSTVTAVTTVSTVTAVTAITNALPAGTNLMGKVGIDQTTVGTTNGVSIAQIGANTVLTSNGASGTGAQRVNISNDNTGIANWGHGATGSAVPAGATYIGGLAQTALPTAATAGNLTGAMVDKFGRQVVNVATIRDLVGTQTTTLSATTSETTIVTAIASTFNDLVMLIISNTSASTNTRIDFRDTTGGTVLFSLQSNGGQPPVGFALPVPIPQTSVNTNWTATCATSTTDVRIYAVYAKNK